MRARRALEPRQLGAPRAGLVLALVPLLDAQPLVLERQVARERLEPVEVVVAVERNQVGILGDVLSAARAREDRALERRDRLAAPARLGLRAGQVVERVRARVDRVLA